MHLKHLINPQELGSAFSTFLELRPHLPSVQHFIYQVTEQQKQGYEIVAVMQDKNVIACMGFRIITTLASGKILYIDDLITKEEWRGQGCSTLLLDYVKGIAQKQSCTQIHLDTGYTRHGAHKVYMKYGFQLECHHLALKI